MGASQPRLTKISAELIALSRSQARPSGLTIRKSRDSCDSRGLVVKKTKD
jgi:hypothetical protein